MKKNLTLILMFICVFGFAQNESRLDRIKALRVAFIANKLDLTTDEAQKFWPIFNEFEAKQIDLRKQKRQLMFKLRSENASGISDNEMLKLLEDSGNIESDILISNRKFIKDLQGVISPQKIVQLKTLEEDFKKAILKQYKKKASER